MKKKDIKLKGQLKLYMQWPGIMILFLILMNIWIFRMDRKAGLLMECVCAGFMQSSLALCILQQVFDSGRHGRVCSAVRDCPEYTSEGTFDSVCDFTG